MSASRSEISTAFGDGAGEEPFRELGSSEHAHRNAAGRFTENRDAARVSAECSDIAFDPLQPGDLVQQAVVPRMTSLFGGELWMREKAERSNAISDADDHDTFLREIRAVIERHRSGTNREAA